MNRLMSQLRSATAADAADRVDLAALVRDVATAHQRQRPAPRYEGPATPVPVRAEPDRLSAVIGHIVQNAQDATPPTGEVEIGLAVSSGRATVTVRDTGAGMDDAFIRERLFRPFDSTKGLTGMGIGAYECREFVTSLGGWVEVRSAPGKGTSFTIVIPTADAAGEG
jgi:signal transduction histidine kinase